MVHHVLENANQVLFGRFDQDMVGTKESGGFSGDRRLVR